MRTTLRSLAKRPGFALTALLTTAVAIGGNTAIFSVVRGVLLASLPFRDASELVTLDARAPTGFQISVSAPNYRDWAAAPGVFSSSAAASWWTLTSSNKESATSVNAQAVLGDFFGTLGVQTQLGRPISAAETEPGAEAVVVLGSGYWRRTYGADPGILGRVITLDGRPYAVAGVLAEGADYPNPDVDLYLPLGSLPDIPWNDRRSAFGMRAIGRLAPGVTLERARADLTRTGLQVREANTADTALPEIRSMEDSIVGSVRLQIWLLMGGVACVLLIAVANVANLLLARGEERHQEMAIRTALGAERGTLVRQVLMESVVLALVGGVFGVILAQVALKVLLTLFGGTFPAVSLPKIRLDAVVLSFALGLTIVTGLLFGLIPALRLSRVDLYRSIKTRDRVRPVLVVTELALAVILLVGSGLMIESVRHLRATDKGFDPSGVLSAWVRLPRPKYTDPAQWETFYRDALDRLKTEPGIKTAAVSLLLPLSNRSWERGVWPEGVPPTPGTGQSVLFNIVSTDYFATMGVPLVRGRIFTPADRTGSDPVAIIDETMAERFWPGQDPIGKRVTLEGPNHGEMEAPHYRTVIGVAKNVRHYELANPSRIQIYLPWVQLDMPMHPEMSFVVRTSGTPAAAIPTLRRVVTETDPGVALSSVQPLGQYMEASLAGGQTLSDLLATFGAVALLLAAVGVFGVMSYTVARRTREIGVRMALGATRHLVLGGVAGEALKLGAIGVAIGAVAAAGLSRLLTRMLFQVSAVEPAVYGGVALLLLSAALLAALLPAWRAARVNPIEALRSD